MSAIPLSTDHVKPTVELAIERYKGQYFVLVIDDVDINQVGPLTKKQALKLHYALAVAAICSGGLTQPIRKPHVKTVNANRKSRLRPVKNYPISNELLAYISS